jgi:signal transduction histidine kinase
MLVGSEKPLRTGDSSLKEERIVPSHLRTLVGLAGGVYLVWWFLVQALLPGSFNPLPGRLAVVLLAWLLVGASYRSRRVAARLSGLFTAWVCVLVAHYCYLVIGNHGDATWWLGAFVTVAAASMCLQSPREVSVFSAFALGCVVVAAAIERQLARSIYVPGLATILLLAYVTKRSQLEVQRSREAVEAANRELEAFNYSVAHDLRAPLRSIAGFSHIVLEDHAKDLDATGQDHLRRVIAAASHMARLIDGMLALGRVTRANLRKQRVDLSALARSHARRLAELQPGRSVRFEIEDGLAERGDAALIDTALENLLSNAWKFTRDTPDAVIAFGVDRSDGRAAYFVRDNGAGFDMAYASKLFGVFQRLHTASEFEGTGIGLATVQRIVQRHGGRVWAEGKVGEGACFHFTLAEGDHGGSGARS